MSADQTTCDGLQRPTFKLNAEVQIADCPRSLRGHTQAHGELLQFPLGESLILRSSSSHSTPPRRPCAHTKSAAWFIWILQTWHSIRYIVAHDKFLTHGLGNERRPRFGYGKRRGRTAEVLWHHDVHAAI